MTKQPIGVLDGGFEGILIFNKLVKDYPHETFIYTNDSDNYPYEGQDEKDIINSLKKTTKILTDYNVSMIIVVNNSIIEYGEEFLSKLEVPVYKFSDFIIDYVNANYEHKNMAILAKQYIIKANIYQKNIHYNHLYSMTSDELDEIVNNKQIRTAKSFAAMRNAVSQIKGKEYSVLVVTDSYLNEFRIEFNEYVDCKDIINVSDIVSNAMKDKFNNEIKSFKKSFIVSKLEKKDFYEKAYLLNCKCKYVKLG